MTYFSVFNCIHMNIHAMKIAYKVQFNILHKTKGMSDRQRSVCILNVIIGGSTHLP